MATLKDVARLANVDVSTVSRALNHTSYVHPETKKKIYAAVEQLSYKPNLLAKGLRQGKRHTIGVVIPEINFSIFGEMVQGIEIQARKMGYSIIICNTKDRQDAEEECLSRLRNGLVDGILIAATGQNGRLLRDIKSSGISVMQIVRNQDSILSSVVADYYACGYQGVKYLYGKGCRHIGFINGSMEIIPYKERYKGYRKAIRELSSTEYVADSPFPPKDYFKNGYNGILELMEKDTALDGLMVAVDMQGLGAIRALKERGIKVPEEVKIISLTGHSIGGMLETAMTSMEVPAKEMGEEVTRMIISDIEGGPDKKNSPFHKVFEASLIERETT
ncbi:LacI family DNA-binding transcriptional regulator [Lacrimispora sp. AGF001]|uniref:LacI family DNA-binding transcriptional regulator n=1 Tax=Lacrimispora sp. AGF001 TaxID=3401631 RepID=UPI003B438C4A